LNFFFSVNQQGRIDMRFDYISGWDYQLKPEASNR